jgi:hypothetical protein
MLTSKTQTGTSETGRWPVSIGTPALRFLLLVFLLTPVLGTIQMVIDHAAATPPPVEVVTRVVEVPRTVYVEVPVEVPVPQFVIVQVPPLIEAAPESPVVAGVAQPELEEETAEAEPLIELVAEAQPEAPLAVLPVISQASVAPARAQPVTTTPAPEQAVAESPSADESEPGPAVASPGEPAGEGATEQAAPEELLVVAVGPAESEVAAQQDSKSDDDKSDDDKSDDNNGNAGQASKPPKAKKVK